MAKTGEYVQTDEKGVLRVGNTRVRLDSVLGAWGQGQSPEQIRQDYPVLTLEEVYGAITYSLAHAADVEAYLKRQAVESRAWRARVEGDAPPLLARLKATRRERGGTAA